MHNHHKETAINNQIFCWVFYSLNSLGIFTLMIYLWGSSNDAVKPGKVVDTLNFLIQFWKYYGFEKIQDNNLGETLLVQSDLTTHCTCEAVYQTKYM